MEGREERLMIDVGDDDMFDLPGDPEPETETLDLSYQVDASSLVTPASRSPRRIRSRLFTRSPKSRSSFLLSLLTFVTGITGLLGVALLASGVYLGGRWTWNAVSSWLAVRRTNAAFSYYCDLSIRQDAQWSGWRFDLLLRQGQLSSPLRDAVARGRRIDVGTAPAIVFPLLDGEAIVGRDMSRPANVGYVLVRWPAAKEFCEALIPLGIVSESGVFRVDEQGLVTGPLVPGLLARVGLAPDGGVQGILLTSVP